MFDFKKFQNMNEFYRALHRIKNEIKINMRNQIYSVMVYSFESNDDRNSMIAFIDAWFKSDDIKQNIFGDENYAGNEFYIVIVR